jgi:lantibiotic modifying enzyme
MSAALARLARATGESRFADGARRAIAYERSVFVREQSNWPDFRSSADPNHFMWSWCHGAPGILLARHVIVSTGLADDQTVGEQEMARTSTVAELMRQLNAHHAEPAAHLCCGVLGLTSLLRIDADAAGGAINPVVEQAETMLIEQAQINGSYTLFSVENGSLNLPGLLTGKAGVALALLEAADGMRLLPAVLSAGLINPSVNFSNRTLASLQQA